MRKRRRAARVIRRFFFRLACLGGAVFLSLAPLRSDALVPSKIESEIATNADSISIVGTNFVGKGNVLIRYKEFIIRADSAIVNITTKDVEAVGNVMFIQREHKEDSVSMEAYMKLKERRDMRINIIGYTVDPLGRQKLRISIFKDEKVFKAAKAVGNLATGTIEFTEFNCGADVYYCKGAYAMRTPDGTIVINDAMMSSCDYMMDGHEHYSINAGTVKIFPRDGAEASLSKYNPDTGEHSVWAYNCTVKVAGVPVFWVPAMYKPPDQDLGWFQASGGHDSDWGYFLQLSKSFKLLDYPDTVSKFMLDYYSKRGLAGGNETKIRTEESVTELFVYGLYDKAPYETWTDEGDDLEQVKNTRRIMIPHIRYDLHLTNLTHITPRLDFRGRIEKLSDYQFLSDFFSDRAYNDPQPVTFASAEYQFDRASAAVLVRPKINSFFSEVQRLPEFRLDTQRQELLENIYHQSETNITNLRMNWRHYDNERTAWNYIDPSNYNTFRADTNQFLYYPFSLSWFNFTPRAGMRFTYYQRTSDVDVYTSDLENMFIADSIDGNPASYVMNYNQTNQGKFRVISELGLESNTKIYGTAQNVKSSFLQLDGLRHIMEPYVNYTLIPQTSVTRDRLMYFDDIDRINRQNFVRTGLRNVLNTRRGNYGSEAIYEWLSMENYLDYHFIQEGNFAQLGDLGTKLKFNPTDKLSMSTLLLIDAGQSNAHNYPTTRSAYPTEYIDRVGMSNKWVDKLESAITYEIIDNVKLSAGYSYSDVYSSRSAYSMGSTLTDISSGSGFFSGSGARTQTAVLGASFPIPIDNKTFGACRTYYDFEEGCIREISAGISRTFHCWEIQLSAGRAMNRNDEGNKVYKYNFMLSANLVNIPAVKMGRTHSMGSQGADATQPSLSNPNTAGVQ